MKMGEERTESKVYEEEEEEERTELKVYEEERERRTESKADEEQQT